MTVLSSSTEEILEPVYSSACDPSSNYSLDFLLNMIHLFVVIGFFFLLFKTVTKIATTVVDIKKFSLYGIAISVQSNENIKPTIQDINPVVPNSTAVVLNQLKTEPTYGIAASLKTNDGHIFKETFLHEETITRQSRFMTIPKLQYGMKARLNDELRIASKNFIQKENASKKYQKTILEPIMTDLFSSTSSSPSSKKSDKLVTLNIQPIHSLENLAKQSLENGYSEKTSESQTDCVRTSTGSKQQNNSRKESKSLAAEISSSIEELNSKSRELTTIGSSTIERFLNERNVTNSEEPMKLPESPSISQRQSEAEESVKSFTSTEGTPTPTVSYASFERQPIEIYEQNSEIIDEVPGCKSKELENPNDEISTKNSQSNEMKSDHQESETLDSSIRVNSANDSNSKNSNACAQSKDLSKSSLSSITVTHPTETAISLSSATVNLQEIQFSVQESEDMMMPTRFRKSKSLSKSSVTHPTDTLLELSSVSMQEIDYSNQQSEDTKRHTVLKNKSSSSKSSVTHPTETPLDLSSATVNMHEINYPIQESEDMKIERYLKKLSSSKSSDGEPTDTPPDKSRSLNKNLTSTKEHQTSRIEDQYIQENELETDDFKKCIKTNQGPISSFDTDFETKLRQFLSTDTSSEPDPSTKNSQMDQKSFTALEKTKKPNQSNLDPGDLRDGNKIICSNGQKSSYLSDSSKSTHTTASKSLNEKLSDSTDSTLIESLITSLQNPSTMNSSQHPQSEITRFGSKISITKTSTPSLPSLQSSEKLTNSYDYNSLPSSKHTMKTASQIKKSVNFGRNSQHLYEVPSTTVNLFSTDDRVLDFIRSNSQIKPVSNSQFPENLSTLQSGHEILVEANSKTNLSVKETYDLDSTSILR